MKKSCGFESEQREMLFIFLHILHFQFVSFPMFFFQLPFHGRAASASTAIEKFFKKKIKTKNGRRINADECMPVPCSNPAFSVLGLKYTTGDEPD